MAFTCAQGAFARLYVKSGSSPYTWDGTSETYEFLAESMQKRGTLVNTNGIRGTRSAASERTRLGPYTIGGGILFNPDPAMLDNWLPRILGAAEVANVFGLAEGLPAFGVLINKVNGRFEYKDCYVNRAILRGSRVAPGGAPEPISLSVELFAMDRTAIASAPSAPAVNLTFAANSYPYIFEDGVFSYDQPGSVREILDFVMVVNNHLQIRTSNSLIPTAICPQDRTVSLQFTVPFVNSNPDNTVLLDMAPAGLGDARLKFTNGIYSMQIDFTSLQIANEDPVVRGKQEIVLPLSGITRTVAGVSELSITSNSS